MQCLMTAEAMRNWHENQRHQWVFVITTLRNSAEFAVRGIWKYLYRDYNFVQKPLWSWSGLYHLLLSPNQWLPEVFVWTQWACFQEGANNRVVTSVTIVTSWVSPDYVNHGADEVFSQFLAASNIQIAPGWHSWVSLVCVMSYDLISLNVWAPNVISVSIRIFLGPSISRVSGPCWCLCPASLWGRQSCSTNTRAQSSVGSHSGHFSPVPVVQIIWSDSMRKH